MHYSITNITQSLMKLPFINDRIGGYVAQQIVALRYSGSVVKKQCPVDVVVGETGYQVKSKKKPDAIVWCLVPPSNILDVPVKKLRNRNAKKIGRAVLSWCNLNMKGCMEELELSSVVLSKFIVSEGLYTERKLSAPNIFDQDGFDWCFNTQADSSKLDRRFLRGYKDDVLVFTWALGTGHQLYINDEALAFNTQFSHAEIFQVNPESLSIGDLVGLLQGI